MAAELLSLESSGAAKLFNEATACPDEVQQGAPAEKGTNDAQPSHEDAGDLRES